MTKSYYSIVVPGALGTIAEGVWLIRLYYSIVVNRILGEVQFLSKNSSQHKFCVVHSCMWRVCMCAWCVRVCVCGEREREEEMLYYHKVTYIVNPRRACAARVTVLRLSVCLCVCLSVCLSVCYN